MENIIKLNASIFIMVEGLSAHGDQKDLFNWLSDLEEKPKKVFLIHGENMLQMNFELR